MAGFRFSGDVLATLTFEELASASEVPLGRTDWIAVDQQSISAFARVTRDEQWIHTDPVAASAGPFGNTIAHGYLTLSLVSHVLQQLLVVVDCSMAINYGLDRVRFPSVVPAGSLIRASAVLTRAAPVQGGFQTWVTVTMECDRSERPVLVADVLSRFLA